MGADMCQKRQDSGSFKYFRRPSREKTLHNMISYIHNKHERQRQTDRQRERQTDRQTERTQWKISVILHSL